MIIFLHGQDSYGIIQYINRLIERYHKKYPDSFNLHRFDLEEDNPDEIKNAVKGVSFFKQVKFIVIKNPLAKPGFVEKIIKEGGVAEEKDAVLLLYQNSSEKDLKDKNGKLLSLLKKDAQLKEFKSPTNQTVNKFVSNFLAENKVSVPRQALAKLTKETVSDFWRLKNELVKIISFAKQEKKSSISEEEMISLMSFKIDRNIFNLVDAAFSNQGRAVILFEDYFSGGGDPLYLLSMIAFQLKNMLIVRELLDKKYQYAQVLKKTGMHPFFFRKNYEAAQKYSLDELKIIFQRVADFEMALKTGQAEAENIFFSIFL